MLSNVDGKVEVTFISVSLSEANKIRGDKINKSGYSVASFVFIKFELRRRSK